jgi:hypothetical protein
MYLPDELWSIVKEYAGIYSVGTNFNVSKVSKDKLLQYYSENFKWRIKILSKYKANEVKRIIMNDIRFRMTEMKWVYLWNVCNPIKEENPSGLNGYLGELISWRDSGECCLGEIVGYYKHSYKVKRFKTKITNVETLPVYRKVDGRYTTIVDNVTWTTHTYIKDKYYKGTYKVDTYRYLSSKDGNRPLFSYWIHEFNPNYKPTYETYFGD